MLMLHQEKETKIIAFKTIVKCLDRSHWYYCHIADSLRVISLIFWIQEKEKKRKSRMAQMTQYCQNWYSTSPLVRQREILLQPREWYNPGFCAFLSESHVSGFQSAHSKFPYILNLSQAHLVMWMQHLY